MFFERASRRSNLGRIDWHLSPIIFTTTAFVSGAAIHCPISLPMTFRDSLQWISWQFTQMSTENFNVFATAAGLLCRKDETVCFPMLSTALPKKNFRCLEIALTSPSRISPQSSLVPNSISTMEVRQAIKLVTINLLSRTKQFWADHQPLNLVQKI